MARRALGPAALRVTRAVAEALPDGPVTVGCSGGADSLALALAAHEACARVGQSAEAVVVDHGLQEGSADVAQHTVAVLRERGLSASVVPVTVTPGRDGLEAAARDARLAALAGIGRPVLLGHTLDDQAEGVLLGLLRGSGARSLAGMAPARGPFLRPLLGLRRADTQAACRDWGLQWWSDPMNEDPQFARVRARRVLAALGSELGRDLAPALARTARLARADADLLDELALAQMPAPGEPVAVDQLTQLPEALRWRVLRRWLADGGISADQEATFAVDQLLTRWHGQGPLSLPGGRVQRAAGKLRILAPESPPVGASSPESR